jgi:GR25 family glycosyltransferase involved in LPS biosynthesis
MNIGPIFNKLFGTAYIKNLKNSINRRSHIEEELKLIELNSYSIVEAVEGVLHFDHNFELQHGRFLLKYPSSAGFMGCQMTSHKIIEQAISSNETTIMMMDDDCVFNHTTELNENSLKTIESNLPEDWDIVILGDIQHEGVSSKCPPKLLENCSIEYRKCLVHDEAAGSHGIAVHNRVFPDLLQELSDTKFLGDGAIGRMIDIQKNVYKINPSLCIQDRTLFSDINHIHHNQ